MVDIGVDIVEIDRMKHAHKRQGKRFLNRLFTAGEVSYCFKKKNAYPHLAARFAAKEAVFKALNIKKMRALPWKEIEVVSQKTGKPLIKLFGALAKEAKAKKFNKIMVSLSHSRHYAVAQIVVV